MKGDSAMENASKTAGDEPFRPTRRIHGEARTAFTLVELLAVILIVGMLAAILTPVVMQSLTKARNTAIKAEIDMLHMAMMNYKNEHGSFPPCLSAAGAPSPAASHVQRQFPRAQSVIATQVPSPVTPATALLWWLDGYTSVPTRPMIGEDLDFDSVLDPGEDINGNNRLDTLERVKLFDYDRSRKATVPGAVTGVYFSAGKPRAPFIYINSAMYQSLDYRNTPIGPTTPSPGWPLPTTTFSYSDGTTTYTISAATYFPHKTPPSTSLTTPWQNQWSVPTQQYFNEDTFQILSAGRDEEFGTDDDLSNFWPGTRREYLDSLR